MKLLKLLLLSGILFFGFKLNAQYFGGGFSAGLSASQLRGDMRTGFDKIGLTAGIYINRSFGGGSWLWGTEMHYIGKGSVSNQKLPNGGQIQDFKNSLHYIEFPIYLKYRFTEKIASGGGIAPAYFLSARFTSYGSVLPSNYYEIKKIDIGPMWFIDYRLGERTSASMRFFYSAFPIANNIGWFNNTISLSLKFDLKN